MSSTLEDARTIAKRLKEKSSKIQGVDLFGSVLRNGIGNDIDLFFLVEDGIAREFWRDMSDMRILLAPELHFVYRAFKKFFPGLNRMFMSMSKRKRRVHARVSAIIGFDVDLFAEEYRPGTKLGIWLLPLDWRAGFTLNESSILRVAPNVAADRKTLLTLKLIARVAQKIA